MTGFTFANILKFKENDKGGKGKNPHQGKQATPSKEEEKKEPSQEFVASP